MQLSLARELFPVTTGQEQLCEGTVSGLPLDEGTHQRTEKRVAIEVCRKRGTGSSTCCYKCEMVMGMVSWMDMSQVDGKTVVSSWPWQGMLLTEMGTLFSCYIFFMFLLYFSVIILHYPKS